MKNNEIWWIILTYYPSKNHLAQILNALHDQHVLVVDNTQGRKNLGYAGGMNVGIRKALDKNAAWIILVNQDISIDNTTVHRVVSELQRLSPGLAGPYAGSLDPKRWTTILPGEKSYLSGSFLATHQNVVETIGMLYEPYFLYYEDAEYSIRAKNAGFPLHVISSVGIQHLKKQSTPDEEYYLARNHLLFVERNAPFEVKLHEMIRFPRTMWKHYSRKNYEALIGICDYCLRRFGRRI